MESKTLILIIAIGFPHFHLTTKGQGLQETYDFAEKQLKCNNYDNAIMALKRVLYFEDGNFDYKCYQGLARCYYQQESYDKASEYYQKAYSHSDMDSLNLIFRFNEINCLLLANKFQHAYLALIKMPKKDSFPKKLYRRKHLYFGITYFGMEKFHKSKDHFFKTMPDSAMIERCKVDDLICKAKNPKVNTTLVKTLSSIFPGFGQVYLGNIKDGVNSFLLTGGLAVLTIINAHQLTWFDGIASIGPWFLRYYLGGIENTEKLAQQKLRKTRKTKYDKILDMLSEDKSINE